MTDPLADALARPDLAEHARHKLQNVRDVLHEDSQARLLQLFFLGDEPYATIAFGDVATADLVVVVMHGIATDLSELPSWADTIRRLCADVIRAVTVRGGSARVATIAWFGYDSGTHATALATAHATIGAARLGADLDRIRAANPTAAIAVVGYSYSSTLFGELVVLGASSEVDAAFSIGSAGLTRMAAGAIEDAIAAGQLIYYATEASADAVAPLGRFGQHPVDPRDIEGAVVYDADGGPVAGSDGTRGLATTGHASRTSVDEQGRTDRGYFDPHAQAYLFLVERLADLALST
ncbi:alpha/beta hydrolase [Microbacterium resistens]